MATDKDPSDRGAGSDEEDFGDEFKHDQRHRVRDGQ